MRCVIVGVVEKKSLETFANGVWTNVIDFNIEEIDREFGEGKLPPVQSALNVTEPPEKIQVAASPRNSGSVSQVRPRRIVLSGIIADLLRFLDAGDYLEIHLSIDAEYYWYPADFEISNSDTGPTLRDYYTAYHAQDRDIHFVQAICQGFDHFPLKFDAIFFSRFKKKLPTVRLPFFAKAKLRKEFVRENILGILEDPLRLRHEFVKLHNLISLDQPRVMGVVLDVTFRDQYVSISFTDDSLTDLWPSATNAMLRNDPTRFQVASITLQLQKDVLKDGAPLIRRGSLIVLDEFLTSMSKGRFFDFRSCRDTSGACLVFPLPCKKEKFSFSNFFPLTPKTRLGGNAMVSPKNWQTSGLTRGGQVRLLELLKFARVTVGKEIDSFHSTYQTSISKLINEQPLVYGETEVEQKYGDIVGYVAEVGYGEPLEVYSTESEPPKRQDKKIAFRVFVLDNSSSSELIVAQLTSNINLSGNLVGSCQKWFASGKIRSGTLLNLKNVAVFPKIFGAEVVTSQDASECTDIVESDELYNNSKRILGWNKGVRLTSLADLDSLTNKYDENEYSAVNLRKVISTKRRSMACEMNLQHWLDTLLPPPHQPFKEEIVTTFQTPHLSHSKPRSAQDLHTLMQSRISVLDNFESISLLMETANQQEEWCGILENVRFVGAVPMTSSLISNEESCFLEPLDLDDFGQLISFECPACGIFSFLGDLLHVQSSKESPKAILALESGEVLGSLEDLPEEEIEEFGEKELCESVEDHFPNFKFSAWFFGVFSDGEGNTLRVMIKDDPQFRLLDVDYSNLVKIRQGNIVLSQEENKNFMKFFDAIGDEKGEKSFRHRISIVKKKIECHRNPNFAITDFHLIDTIIV